MEVYGLTGGIGSGKSTVAHLLEEYGIPVVSADELSRMVVAPGSRGLTDVVEAFGTEVLDEKGELDRKKMGHIVFKTPERRRQLEAILHPRIRERYEQVLDALEKAGHPVMVYEVPLLFEKNLDQQDEMTAVILVTATADTRIARVKERDSLTTDEVLSRMQAQMPEQEKRERANYIIHNDGDLDDLRREVEYLLSRFLRIAPRTDTPLLEDVVELEEEVELVDESEIDTLSPNLMAEQPTRPIDVPIPTQAVELPVSMPMPAASPLAAPPQLEVELQPIASPIPTSAPKAEAGSARSGASWIPATPKPTAPASAPAPAPAPAPAVAPAPAPTAAAPRQRSSTAPQLEVPDMAHPDSQDAQEDPTR